MKAAGRDYKVFCLERDLHEILGHPREFNRDPLVNFPGIFTSVSRAASAESNSGWGKKETLETESKGRKVSYTHTYIIEFGLS